MSQIWTDRLLSVAGPHEEAGWRDNIYWFRVFMFVHMGARCVLTLYGRNTAHELEVWICRGIIVVAVVGLLPSGWLRLWITRLAAVLVGIEVWSTVPGTANHVFVEFCCLTFLALLNDREDTEAELLLRVMRWMAAVFFFYTGLQKLLYGFYFNGEFLAFLAATEERFALLFQWFIPAEQLDTMQSFNARRVLVNQFEPHLGSGPYRVDSVMFIALSNFVYIFEMVAGIALLFRKTRMWAALCSIVFVVMIEIAARELTFGMLMTALLLLYVPRAPLRAALPVAVAGYGYLVAAAAWPETIPMFWYAPA